MNVGHVQGGTHAGWKIQRPAPKTWTCRCPIVAQKRSVYLQPGIVAVPPQSYAPRKQPAYMSRCTDCGTRRDA